MRSLFRKIFFVYYFLHGKCDVTLNENLINSHISRHDFNLRFEEKVIKSSISPISEEKKKDEK